MSWARCDQCGAFINTDNDPDACIDDDGEFGFKCWKCREDHEDEQEIQDE